MPHFRKLLLTFTMLSMSLLSMSVLAQTPDVVTSSPIENFNIPGPITEFITSDWKDPNEWHFYMGPMKKKDLTILRLTRKIPGGAFGLQCTRITGNLELSFIIDNYTPKEDVQSYNLNIGEKSGPVEMKSIRSSETPEVILTINNPTVITDLLYEMSKVSPGEIISLETPDNKIFNITSPRQTDLMPIVANVCDEWHNQAVSQAVK